MPTLQWPSKAKKEDTSNFWTLTGKRLQGLNMFVDETKLIMMDIID